MKDYIRISEGSAVIERPREDAQNARVFIGDYTDYRILVLSVERLARERGVISILVESRLEGLEIASLTELGYTYVCSKPHNKVLMAKMI